MDKEIFEKAFELCLKKQSNQEIFGILRRGDDVEKQIGILQLEHVQNDDEAELLLFHLTNQDGPIREACAIKLHEFFTEGAGAIFDKTKYYSKFCDAVCDVNPNICRLIVDFLPKLQNQSALFELLAEKVENIYSRIDSPDIEQKNFLTVRLFNLYWTLEAVGAIMSDDFDLARLKLLLARATSYNDYTINEKTAKIITYSQKTREIFSETFFELEKDVNFYVRRWIDGV